MVIASKRSSKRLITFDLVKSVAILGMVFLHSFLYNWEGAEDARILPGDPPPDVIVQVLFYIISMAGLFFIISSALTSYKAYNRLVSKKNTLKQLTWSGIITGIVIYFVHFFFILVVKPESGYLYLWILNDPEQPILSLSQMLQALIHQDALAIIGLNLIVVSLVLNLLFRNEGYTRSTRNYVILGIVGTVILALTPFVRSILFPIVQAAIDNEKYLFAMMINSLCGDWFPLFPYLGYAFYGLILGLALAKKESYNKSSLVLFSVGLVWLLIGSLGLKIRFGSIYTGLYEELSHRGMVFRSFLQYSQIGLSLLLIVFLLRVLDYRPDEIREKYIKKLSWLNRSGLVSLTIFLYEALVKALFGRLLYFIWPLWAKEMWSIAIFGFISVMFWIVIAKLWQSINFKGSLEWTIPKIVELFTGKKTDKFVHSLPNGSHAK